MINPSEDVNTPRAPLRTRWVVGLLLCLVVATAFAQSPLASLAAVTDDGIRQQADGDWLSWRRDFSSTGYSPLDQINRDNVADLRLAWAWPMAPGQSEQEPLVYDGIMFLPHPGNVVQALDATNGEMIWEYRRQLPQGFGVRVNRNIALYDDKVFLATRDTAVVALDVRTGAVVWETQVLDPSLGAEFTAGPIVGNGKIFAATTCGDPICFLSAFDAQSGEELWRRESIAGPGDPEEHNATWGDVPYEGREKASMWMAGSFDPDLNMVYWSTASPYPYPEMFRGTGDGDVLYTNSILAMDGDTGEIVWFFQMQPRDNYDMDHQDNPILADIEIDGELRQIVMVIGKPGILWAFDRVTGEHLWNSQIVTHQNIYESIDPVTGAIVMNTEIIPTEVGQHVPVCPGMRGGSLFQTKAYNPETGVIFVPVSNACTIFETIPPEVHSRGLNWDNHTYMPDSDELVGRLAAVDAATGTVLWNYDQRTAMGSALATGGGLVFAGDLHRYFRAFDADTGEVLWEIPLSTPATGYPMTYSVNGTQYVAIGIGGGTAGTNALASLYPEFRVQSGNNLVMVFSLGNDN